MKHLHSRTLFEKIWEAHVVHQENNAPAILYVDRHLVHEVTSPQAFSELRKRGIKVRCPEKTNATVDHSIPTMGEGANRLNFADELCRRQIAELENNCNDFGINCLGHADHDQGIVHVIGPEQGLTLPGTTIVCGDSHTSTHGAFGALAFGIGTSEVAHVLATQCLLQRRPKTMRIDVSGHLTKGVSAKDIILAVIGQIGIGGATGHVIEYTGSAIYDLNMEERMTVCNMSIECGARAGLIAPDQKTLDFLDQYTRVLNGADREQKSEAFLSLTSDIGATFDRTIQLDANRLQPMITYGTNPSMAIGITKNLPDPDDLSNPIDRKALINALKYMGLTGGQPIIGQHIDVVFIGSCTNGRITDIRAAAGMLRGRKVAPDVRVLVVPGSYKVKRQAEAESLDKIFTAAGAEWREPGCSLCIAMNGDQVMPGQYAVSTSNRNFEGRQGKGARTLLASPLTAAAAAISGKIVDPRKFLS